MQYSLDLALLFALEESGDQKYLIDSMAPLKVVLGTKLSQKESSFCGMYESSSFVNF